VNGLQMADLRSRKLLRTMIPGRSACLRSAICVLISFAVLVADAGAQRGGRVRRGEFGFGGALGDEGFATPRGFVGNPEYDGRFTFARVKYRGYGYGAGWSHDYPRAEVNFMTVLRDITEMHPFVQKGPIVGGAIIALDDPLLFKYPWAYLSEPGGWFPNEDEVKGLRNYLMKGGFLLVDDFPYEAWPTFIAAMGKAMPELKPMRVTGREPIFDSFFKVDFEKIKRGISGGGGNARDGAFFAFFEENDPTKRLIVLAAYGWDLGDDWEWSGTGFMPMDVSNEAFKAGVNMIIYALTH
jgi:hypothetical protein